ncbi:MAG: LacI family DNA-binding transcriptional regulator [Eubacteriales bacterium]|nr:LacI family DNA-binding transcriptional regulator [Eubacteriales bacterium]
MATIKEVAQIAQVSTATVSHVMNNTKNISEETKKRVYAAIQKANYIPNAVAKSLRSGSSKTIGVLVEDIRGLPVAGIVNGISETLEPTGYSMLLYDLHLLDKLYNQYEQIGAYREKINRGIAVLLQSHVDGIIYVGMHDRHLDGLFDPIQRPLVFAYSHGSTKEAFVTYSNLDSAAQLTEYLIENGHTRIAVLAGHPHSYPTQMRLKGFRQAMEAHQLPCPPEYLRYGDWSYESGEKEAAGFLSLNERPTAVFAMNDLMAIGCVHALQDAGLRVPEDISIVGFDNRECSCYVRPPLTTADLPTKEIGVQAAGMIVAMLQAGQDNAKEILLPCKLIYRQSVADLR